MTSAAPLIPVRMLNEYVYCPRLAYMMWVQGEFAHNEYTLEGVIRHKRVDKKGGAELPERPEETEKIHARSVSLSSELLGITAKMDLVEGEGRRVTPVDYKRGKRPHVTGGVYDPERVQICAQGLLLREHGYDVDEGVIYFCESRERVKIPLDKELVDFTKAAIAQIGDLGTTEIPVPLEDSPKCPRCSLVGICLPDEVRFLSHLAAETRPIIPAKEEGLPLYIQSPRAYVRKVGDNLVIEVEKVKEAEARLAETSQVVLYGSAAMTTPALHECLRREIPVTWLTYGGWFVGHTVSTGHRNVETRTNQYHASFDTQICLKLARRLVAGKIANCRTLLRRNWRKSEEDDDTLLRTVQENMRADIRQALRAPSLDILLGIEGNSAATYFRCFPRMLKAERKGESLFDFTTRNRRPPKDPINAMLSFAYSMLAREWTITLAAVGLDPYRGFYHQPRFGRPALSLDMMEPFRPLIADSVVLMSVNNGEVQPKDFISMAGGCNLTEGGRKKFIAAFERRLNQDVTHPLFKYRISYRRLFEVQARLLLRHLAGEIPHFHVFTTR